MNTKQWGGQSVEPTVGKCKTATFASRPLPFLILVGGGALLIKGGGYGNILPFMTIQDHT